MNTKKEIAKRLIELGGGTPPNDLPDSLQDIFKDYDKRPAENNNKGSDYRDESI